MCLYEWVCIPTVQVGWSSLIRCCCALQISGEIERSDIPFEGEESFEGELSEAASQDQERDINDDIIVVGELYTASWCRHLLTFTLVNPKIISPDSNHHHLRSSSSSLLVIRGTQLSTVGDRAFPVAESRLWNSLPPDVTLALTQFFGTASKLTSFPDHFLPNCFQFPVLYTVYSSGLAVFYLGRSK